MISTTNDNVAGHRTAQVSDRSDPVLGVLDDILPDLDGFYKDLHANPELSMQEERTAGKVAERLKAAGFEVTEGVGKTGVVGLLENGEGPTVMVRADMDALPVKEDTGLSYASNKTATDAAVLTVGTLQAGTKDNVIPDEATIKLNVRTFDEDIRYKVLGTIERIVEAEAEASGAPKPPEVTPIDRFPLTVNDPNATGRVARAFRDYFDHDHVEELPDPVSASEDFGSFGTEWHAPSVFWYIGGTDPDAYNKAMQSGRVAQDNPINHSPGFAPVIHPTLETGVEAIVVAARAWLS